MLTINKLLAQGRGLAPALLRRAATVELSWEVRQRSRFEAVDSSGARLAVFLPRGSIVRGADVLVAEDGSLRLVRAAVEPVLMVRICPEHGNSADLIRAAYHLGNRHVALDIRPDRLLLEPDPVLAALLRRMHLTVAEVDAPFEPEGGAYGPAHAAANAAPSEHGGGGLGSKQHSSHDHSDHDHSGDDHSGDGFSSHDHSGHEHGRREHSGHKHGGHKH